MFVKKNKMRQNRIRHLADAMKSTEVGAQLTHEMIAEVVGLEPCPPDIFRAAHKLANREAGVYFSSKRGIGYIKMPATEWDGIAGKYRTRARRQAASGRKFVTNIVGKTNELSDEEQRRASREIGLLQTVEALTRRTAASP